MVHALSQHTPTSPYNAVGAAQIEGAAPSDDAASLLLAHFEAAAAEEGTQVIDFRHNSEVSALIEQVKESHPEIAFGDEHIWHRGAALDDIMRSLQNAKAALPDEPVSAVVPSKGRSPTGDYHLGLLILQLQNDFYDTRSAKIRELKKTGLDDTGAEADEIDKLLAYINAANTEGGPKTVDFKDNAEAKKLVDSIKQKHPEIFGKENAYSWKKGKEVDNLITNLQTQAQTLRSKQQRTTLEMSPEFEEIGLVAKTGENVAKKSGEEIEHTIRNTGK